MSKYNALWAWIKENGKDSFKLTFAEIEPIAGFPCIETKQARISDVREYDTILLGGGIYASGIAGLSFLKKNIKDLQAGK